MYLFAKMKALEMKMNNTEASMERLGEMIANPTTEAYQNMMNKKGQERLTPDQRHDHYGQLTNQK